MNQEPSGGLGKAVKAAALLTAFALVLWLELGIVVSSVRVSVAVCDHPLLLVALYVLALASCAVLARAFPGRIDQARLTLVVAFGAPVVLWISARGWASSHVGINRPPGMDWWLLMPCAAAAAFLLTALCLPGPEPPIHPRQAL